MSLESLTLWKVNMDTSFKDITGLLGADSASGYGIDDWQLVQVQMSYPQLMERNLIVLWYGKTSLKILKLWLFSKNVIQIEKCFPQSTENSEIEPQN